MRAAPGGKAGACWGRRRAGGSARGLLAAALAPSEEGARRLLRGWRRSLPTHGPERCVSISTAANARPPAPAVGSGRPGRIQHRRRAASPRSSFDLQPRVCLSCCFRTDPAPEQGLGRNPSKPHCS